MQCPRYLYSVSWLSKLIQSNLHLTLATRSVVASHGFNQVSVRLCHFLTITRVTGSESYAQLKAQYRLAHRWCSLLPLFILPHSHAYSPLC